jgi:ATP adenylyltransferase
MDHLWAPWRYENVSRAGTGTRKGVPPALDGWPAGEDLHCVFCNMIAAANYAIQNGMSLEDADRSAFIVYRAEYCFICLNAFPYATGHVLILPYEHLESLAGLNVQAAEELIRLVQKAETALQSVYQPDGLNFGINLGESAGAGIADHLHLHGLPRWRGDTNFMTTTSGTRVLPETLEMTWTKLRRKFSETTGSTENASF